MSSLPLLWNVNANLPSGDMVVVEMGVSRQHAEIVVKDDGCYLHGLVSSNGTYVDDEQVGMEQQRLRDGNQICLGPSKVSFVFRNPADSATQAFTLIQPAVGPQVQSTRTINLPEDPGVAEEALFEGTVHFDVNVEGNMGLVVSFMKTLRESTELRLLRLSNRPEGGVNIPLGLREPVRLRQMLPNMDGVVDAAEAGNGASRDGPVLAVTLAG